MTLPCEHIWKLDHDDTGASWHYCTRCGMELPRNTPLPYAGINLDALQFDLLRELQCFSSFDFSSAENALGVYGQELAEDLQVLEEEGFLHFDETHSVWRPVL